MPPAHTHLNLERPEDFDKFVKHMENCGAFNYIKISEKDKKHNCQYYMRKELRKFLSSRPALNHDVTPLNYQTATKLSKSKTLPTHLLTDIRLRSFKYIPSTPEHYILTDKHNNLLGYRFRLSNPDLLQALSASATTIGTDTQKEKAVRDGLRGGFQSIHLGVWADYAMEPRLTKEHEVAINHSRGFMQANKELWKEIGSALRCISPESYARLIGLPFLHTSQQQLPAAGNIITPDDYPAPYRTHQEEIPE
ncbi:hypothetical protein BJ508DRAFT_380331 [Ascobolus immersus RN42]|uniref:Uncharacterized protein n=1 Tax=Ascobolus immersus RN42 TaxID=1160509 RepID=A0A3N4HSW0_ASCIM|nr:hypothetical protein BJ508DRAFT_380331 [Ascobolus immersus RN42]